jgi:hypothetical protein
MNAKLRWVLALLAIAAMAALIGPSSVAEEAKKEDPKKEENPEKEKRDQQAEIGTLLTTSAQMAEFGRKFKSPEALVAAAELLLRVDVLRNGEKLPEITEKPTDGDKDKPKELEVKAEKTKSFKDEAEDLFDEASTLAGSAPKGTVEALIKTAKARKYKGDGERGTLNGPRTITRALQPGEVHHYDFEYVRQLPAYFAWRNSGQAPIHTTMVTGDFVRVDSFNNCGQISFVPGFSRNYKVEGNHLRIHNVGRVATVYTIIVN